MFSLALQALTLFACASDSPVERANALLKSRNGFSSTISVSVTGLGSAVGSYMVRRPARQRMELKGANVDEVFAQGRNATVHIDRRGSEYTWYPSFQVVADPPEESSPMMKFSIPLFVAAGSIDAYGPRDKWRSVGQEVVGQTMCDIVTVPYIDRPSDADPVRLWIDSSGRVLRIRTVVQAQGGFLTAVTTMLDPRYQAPPESAFDEKIPWGFLPTKAPQMKSAKQTGDRAEIGSLTELPSLKEVTLDSVEPTVLLVTSNDLAPAGDPSQWRALADRVRKAKSRFVQVWIGGKPQTTSRDWPSYWDKDGSFEDRFGPPVTPYLYLVVDNALISAWQGWANGDTDEAATSLLEPLKLRPSR